MTARRVALGCVARKDLHNLKKKYKMKENSGTYYNAIHIVEKWTWEKEI
jgi:hypothetical protein